MRFYQTNIDANARGHIDGSNSNIWCCCCLSSCHGGRGYLGLERRLKQGQVLELSRRAELLNTYRELAQFQKSEDLARLRGVYLRHKAEERRKGDLPIPPRAVNSTFKQRSSLLLPEVQTYQRF